MFPFTWRRRTATAVASTFVGTTLAVVLPPSDAPIPTVGPSQLVLPDMRVEAAVGHIAAAASAMGCDEVGALEAKTALVRRDGALEVERVLAPVAWDLAEAGEVYVLDWCAPTA